MSGDTTITGGKTKRFVTVTGATMEAALYRMVDCPERRQLNFEACNPEAGSYPEARIADALERIAESLERLAHNTGHKRSPNEPMF